MSWEIVGTIMASLGGASIIIAALTNFLGKVWADRIAKQTTAKFTQELEALRSKNTLVLEDLKRKSNSILQEREQFGGISSEVYQNFFQKRVETYILLLKIKNKHCSDTHENFLIDEEDIFGDAYYSTYSSFRKLIIENQLYISNELEKSFSVLQMKAAQFIKEADIAEMRAVESGIESHEASEHRIPIYNKLAIATNDLMLKFLDQLQEDVSKLRSRIEMDKVEGAHNSVSA